MWADKVLIARFPMNSSEMAHILIVEDDINLGQVLFQELKKHNHDVELVENGEAALARVNKYIYDLMLTDLKLPGMDGIELLKKVKTTNPSQPL